MSAITRMQRGWHLGLQSLRIVFRDKTLLLFPLIPFTTAMTLIVSFFLLVGPDKLFWTLFVVNSIEHARYLAIGYVAIAIISVFFSVGLVACTRITIEERDSNFIDGMLAGFRKFHWVVLWAIVSWTIGPLLNLLDHFRYTSGWVRKIAKTNWSQLSYFLLPILVVDNINIFSAIRRSTNATTKTWGEGAVSQLGFMWFFWIMNIPTIALFAYGHYLEGPWPTSLTFVIIAMLYSTIVIYQTISAVLSVVLYKYSTDGAVLKGFDPAWMEEAFVRPKVYVLVAPKTRDTVDGVPAPDGVEPIAEKSGGAMETEAAPAEVRDAVEIEAAPEGGKDTVKTVPVTDGVTPTPTEDLDPTPLPEAGPEQREPNVEPRQEP